MKIKVEYNEKLEARKWSHYIIEPQSLVIIGIHKIEGNN